MPAGRPAWHIAAGTVRKRERNVARAGGVRTGASGWSGLPIFPWGSAGSPVGPASLRPSRLTRPFRQVRPVRSRVTWADNCGVAIPPPSHILLEIAKIHALHRLPAVDANQPRRGKCLTGMERDCGGRCCIRQVEYGTRPGKIPGLYQCRPVGPSILWLLTGALSSMLSAENRSDPC
jgi:hypothetical protein